MWVNKKISFDLKDVHSLLGRFMHYKSPQVPVSRLNFQSRPESKES